MPQLIILLELVGYLKPTTKEPDSPKVTKSSKSARVHLSADQQYGLGYEAIFGKKKGQK